MLLPRLIPGSHKVLGTDRSALSHHPRCVSRAYVRVTRSFNSRDALRCLYVRNDPGKGFAPPWTREGSGALPAPCPPSELRECCCIVVSSASCLVSPYFTVLNSYMNTVYNFVFEETPGTIRCTRFIIYGEVWRDSCTDCGWFRPSEFGTENILDGRNAGDDSRH